MAYLHDIVVILGTALLVASLSHRLRLPAVVGFLLTGALIGPGGLGLVEDVERIEQYAELGVVFLLFVIGLECSPERRRELGGMLLKGGTVQVAATVGVVAALAIAFGQSPQRAVFFGAVVALSSTAIVLKLYDDQRQLESPHGQVSLAILLFQDFLIVPLLLVVPVLAGTAAAGPAEILLRFGGGLSLVAAVFLFGRYPLRKALSFVVHTRVRELFVLAALFSCLGGALITEALGLSPALGAFLAGLVLAETEYHHRVLAETAPFRDVFQSLFFISIGMLLSLDFVAANAPAVLLLALVVVGVKAFSVALGVAAVGLPGRTRLLAGLGLAQIGELSLVLLAVGVAQGLIDAPLYQLFLAAAVLTMVATPGLIALAPRLDAWLKGRRGRTETQSRKATEAQEAGPQAPGEALEGHVLLVGFGLNGRHLARVLRSARVPYRAVELNARTVEDAREAGEPVLYGDATRRDILEACGVEGARIAVFAISDPVALRQAVTLARALNPKLTILARTSRLSEIEELQACGADEVVAQEFETSIEMVTRVLSRLHVPGNVIRTEARLLRADGYQMLRASLAVKGLSAAVLQELVAGTSDTFLLMEGQVAVGRTLRQLDLRQRSGVTILVVLRGDRRLTNPSADLELAAGDVLVLLGSHAEIEDAFRALEATESESEISTEIP